MNNARNFIAVIIGRKGSGKSHVAGQYARRFPRRLILDFTREHIADVPPALVAWSLPECIALLRRVASYQRWTIVAEISPKDTPALLAKLIPLGRGVGYSQAVGGMVIECGEMNQIAPNHSGIADEVANMFSLGRHHWLSVLAAARRPTELHGIVTSQADVICAFRQHHAADVKRIADVMGDRVVPALARLQQWEYLRYYVDYGRLEHVRADGRATEIL